MRGCPFPICSQKIQKGRVGFLLSDDNIELQGAGYGCETMCTVRLQAGWRVALATREVTLSHRQRYAQRSRLNGGSGGRSLQRFGDANYAGLRFCHCLQRAYIFLCPCASSRSRLLKSQHESPLLSLAKRPSID